MIKHLFSLIGCTLSMGASISNAVIEVPHQLINPIDSFTYFFEFTPSITNFDSISAGTYFTRKFYLSFEGVVSENNVNTIDYNVEKVSTTQFGYQYDSTHPYNSLTNMYKSVCNESIRSTNSQIIYTYDISIIYMGFFDGTYINYYCSYYFSDIFANCKIDGSTIEYNNHSDLYSCFALCDLDDLSAYNNAFRYSNIRGSQPKQNNNYYGLMNYQDFYTQCGGFQFTTGSDFRVAFDIIYETSTSELYGSGTSFNAGWQEGYNEGYRDGQSVGYDRGYQDGSANAEITTSSFLKMMGAIADVPVRMITSLYSFDLFGIPTLTIFMSLMTMLLVFFLIRKYIL